MIPAVAPDQSRPCAICGTMGNPDQHHEIHRSMGGADGPTLYACRRCHGWLHPEKQGSGWTITEHSKERLAVTDHRTGEIVMERWNQPAHFKEGKFLQVLGELPRSLRIAYSNYFRYLSPEGMIEASQVLGQLDNESWQAEAALMRCAKLRIPYGEKSEKFTAIVQAFGIAKSKAYLLIQALEAMETEPVFHAVENCPPAAVMLIASAPNPEQAMELWQDRSAANPRYSPAQLRADLKRGASSLDPEPNYCICSSCGSKHVKAGT